MVTPHPTSRSPRRPLLGLALLLLTAPGPGCASEGDPGKAGGKAGKATTTKGKARAVKTFPLVEDCPDPGIPLPGEIHEKLGLTYNEVEGTTLKLDISWPKGGKGPYPLVVLLHPGGWYRGQRGEMRTERVMLTGQGFAAASVDYRLSVGGKNPFPAAIQDARCAVRYLREQAKRFEVDAGRVAVAGTSAGAHLAALLALSGDEPRFNGRCSVTDRPADVSGAVAFYAPLDLRTFMGHSVPEEILNNFLGVSPDEDPAKAALASPIAHLDADDPPILLSHGAKDVLVPVGQSRNFSWLQQNLGVPGRYIEVAEAGHGYFMFKGQSAYRRSTCTALAFLRSVLHLPQPKPPDRKKEPLPPPQDEAEEPPPPPPKTEPWGTLGGPAPEPP